MNKQTGSGDKVCLALISTYEDMSKTFAVMAEQEGIIPYIASATLEEAAAIAKELSSTADAIISRGGTAEYIREVVDIPVVSVPITSFDAIRAIHAVKDRVKEIAFFNYRKTMYGIGDIEKIFNITIHEYTFGCEQDIRYGLEDAKRKGVKLAIGGIIVKRLSPEYGLEGRLIECGEEAVYLSIREAVHLAEVRRMERSRTARINGVLDSITEGIIVTDEQNQVVIYNPAAEKLFKIPSSQVLGESVEAVIPNTRMHTVFKTGEPELAVLQKIHEGNIATNRIPLVLDGKRIGVVSTFEDVTKIQQLEQLIRKQMHAKGCVAKNSFHDITTANTAVGEAKELAALYAGSDAAVLIEGESGTGKELFAQSIHNGSKRAARPFVAVNCAAIPEQLLESELFGYEGGAFTGARKEGKQGLFELAHNGTIFLDEIGEIPPLLQARLLRVLQEKEIMRVGGDRIIPVDIRIISATNKNLEKKIAQGEFRDDLYYRLNVLNLKIPPLRERAEDILLLAKIFLAKKGAAIHLDECSHDLRYMLLNYNWPGNIRELQNVMERLALLAGQPKGELHWERRLHKVMLLPGAADTAMTVRVDVGKGLKHAMEKVEKTIIEKMLEKYDQNQETVAKLLGIGRTTLWRKNKEG